METMTDDNDRLDALEARLDALEAENKQLQEEKDQLADRVDDLEEEKSQLQNENERLRERVDDLEKSAVAAENQSVGAHERINSLKERLEEIDTPTPEGGKTTVQQPETHLEEVCAWSEDIVERELTPNQQRARHVALNLTDYARKTPKGYVIETGDLRTVLKARFDKSHSETVNRVRAFLDEFGGDEIEIKEPRTAGFSPSSKGEKKAKGKMVVVDVSLVKRLVSISNDHDVVTEATA